MAEETRDFLNKDTPKSEGAKNMDASKKGIDLFFGEKERKFLDAVGKELVVGILKESFIYYRVDYKKTRTHSLYGESKKKVYEPEVEIFGRINVESEAPSYMAPGGLIKKGFGKLTANIFTTHLEELQVKIRMGDFMYFSGHYYEIVDDGSSNINNENKYAGDIQFAITVVG